MRNCEVIKVDFTIELFLGLTVGISCSIKDLFHSPLEMGWCVGKAKGHPVPFEFAPVADKGS